MRHRMLSATLAFGLLALLLPTSTSAHCQVPCGIYGDGLRFAALAEDLTTLDKAMVQIAELSKADKPNYNQIVRWVQTKEEHAEKIVNVLTNYFLMQRIKLPPFGDEAGKKRHATMLAQVHELLVLTMKCTQTIDRSHVEAARKVLDAFQHSYEGK